MKNTIISKEKPGCHIDVTNYYHILLVHPSKVSLFIAEIQDRLSLRSNWGVTHNNSHALRRRHEELKGRAIGSTGTGCSLVSFSLSPFIAATYCSLNERQHTNTTNAGWVPTLKECLKLRQSTKRRIDWKYQCHLGIKKQQQKKNLIQCFLRF